MSAILGFQENSTNFQVSWIVVIALQKLIWVVPKWDEIVLKMATKIYNSVITELQ